MAGERLRWIRALRILALALLAAAAAPPASAQQYLSLPVESPVYAELEHFRSLGLWRGSLEIRPITRAEAEHALEQITANPAAAKLDRGDRIRLRRLQDALAALHAAGSDTASSRGPSATGLPPVAWEIETGLQFFGQATGLDSLADLDRRPLRRDNAIHLDINAAVGRHLTAETRNYEDYSRLTPKPKGHWVDNMPPGGKSIFADPSARNDRAAIGVHSSWYDLTYGRQDRRWGTGRRGSLFLSENPFPLDGLSFRFRTRYLSGVSLFAQTLRSPTVTLSADTAGAPPPVNGDAYVAAHRFEFHPPGPASFGFFEAAIWGGRGIDLAYINPVGFLVAMTQDLYDRANADDKKILGADVSIRAHPLTLYGEFLLNRLVSGDVAKASPNPEISSFGELAGLQWADPLGVAGADLNAEYAHLDPEVYFHKDNDPRRAYLEQGELIGHWAGPNSDDLFVSFNGPPFEKAGTLSLDLEQVRWGLINGHRGLEAGFVGLRKSEKRWITGPKQVERTVALRWTRNGWRAPGAGVFDTILTLARVARSGAWSRSASGNGWQAEMRLRWRVGISVFDP